MEEKFITCTVNGENKKFRIIATFNSLETRNNYIVYTDDLFDENNKLNIYASIIKNSKLEDISDEKDWEIVEKFLEKISEENDGN